MALDNIIVVAKEQWEDQPLIPLNKKVTFGDVNDIVDKTKLAITQVNTNTADILTHDGLIEANENRIGPNTTQIALNTAQVALNKTATESNATQIALNKTTTEENGNQIELNTTISILAL